MFSDSRQFVARTDSSSSARLMFSFRSRSESTASLTPPPISIGSSSDTSGPGSVYCTNGLRCLRRILAASTTAICGPTVPLVQISITSRS